MGTMGGSSLVTQSRVRTKCGCFGEEKECSFTSGLALGVILILKHHTFTANPVRPPRAAHVDPEEHPTLPERGAAHHPSAVLLGCMGLGCCHPCNVIWRLL